MSVPYWQVDGYCNCCGSGCDCGCVQDCHLGSHRRAGGPTTRPAHHHHPAASTEESTK